MSSFIRGCHVFLGPPRRLVPGTVRSITMRLTLFICVPLEWGMPKPASSFNCQCHNLFSFVSFHLNFCQLLCRFLRGCAKRSKPALYSTNIYPLARMKFTTSFISNIEHNNITPTICSQHWDGWKGGGQKNILIVVHPHGLYKKLKDGHTLMHRFHLLIRFLFFFVFSAGQCFQPYSHIHF